MVLVLELDMFGSPLASAALAPEGFERLAAFTTTSDERTRNRHGEENSAETGLNDGWIHRQCGAGIDLAVRPVTPIHEPAGFGAVAMVK